MPKAAKAFENPLIPNLRMRALYRVVVELRALQKANRNRAQHLAEACLASIVMNLVEGDLISSPPHAAPLLAHIRAVGRYPSASGSTSTQLRRALKPLPADSFPGSPLERVLCAAGSAMAFKDSAANSIVLSFLHSGDLSSAEWRRLLPILAQPALPLVVVLLPSAGRSPDLDALARRCAPTLPIIPADAGDPIALYRVAQEVILRARTAGGGALVQAVACGTDPVQLLGTQLVRRAVCSRVWLDRMNTRLERLLTPVSTPPRGPAVKVH